MQLLVDTWPPMHAFSGLNKRPCIDARSFRLSTLDLVQETAVGERLRPELYGKPTSLSPEHALRIRDRPAYRPTFANPGPRIEAMLCKPATEFRRSVPDPLANRCTTSSSCVNAAAPTARTRVS